MEFFFICIVLADSKVRSLHRKEPKPATSSGGPPVPQTPPGPRPNAEPEQEPLVGLNPKPESGRHSVAEPQPASEPAAEPAEKSGRSPDLKVTVLFPAGGYDLLLHFG